MNGFEDINYRDNSVVSNTELTEHVVKLFNGRFNTTIKMFFFSKNN